MLNVFEQSLCDNECLALIGTFNTCADLLQPTTNPNGVADPIQTIITTAQNIQPNVHQNYTMEQLDQLRKLQLALAQAVNQRLYHDLMRQVARTSERKAAYELVGMTLNMNQLPGQVYIEEPVPTMVSKVTGFISKGINSLRSRRAATTESNTAQSTHSNPPTRRAATTEGNAPQSSTHPSSKAGNRNSNSF